MTAENESVHPKRGITEREAPHNIVSSSPQMSTLPSNIPTAWNYSRKNSKWKPRVSQPRPKRVSFSLFETTTILQIANVSFETTTILQTPNVSFETRTILQIALTRVYKVGTMGFSCSFLLHTPPNPFITFLSFQMTNRSCKLL